MLSGRPKPDSDRIFAGFDLSSRTSIIAAVSGGSDSLALLLLLKIHLDRTAPGTNLLAVTVDHGLRPEAAAEARAVAALCSAHAIPHRTLRWEDEKPATGLSAAAREARYRLLAEAARAAGTDIVLTGHTRDDQAETVLMRQARGDGRGLAGMAPATIYDGRTWIVRPLLDTGREVLRDFLRSQNITWIEDPSNLKPEYERVRARSLIGGAADPEARKQELVALARQHAAERVALGHRAADVISASVALVSAGLFRLPSDYGSGEPGDARLYALRILLACAGGAEHLPDETRTADLMRLFSVGQSRATLSRAVVDTRASGIFFHREFRGEGPAAVPARDGAIWDGRYRIRANAEDARGLFVAPFGRENARNEPSYAENAPASLVRAALAAEPALWHNGEHLGRLGGDSARQGVTAIPTVAPWAKFLPSFDLAPAMAMAAILATDPVPESPFAGHNPV